MNIKPTKIIKLESIVIVSSDSERQDEMEEYSSEIDINTQAMQFKCTLCPLQFSEKPELQSHVRDHFKSITCDACNKTFIGDKQYNYHVKNAHTGKMTIAETSENTAKSTTSFRKENLKTPIKADDDSVDYLSGDSIESSVNVACDVCGRLFPNITAVIKHRKTHSNEGKRFYCNICNNGFNKKTNLEFHMRIHSNERPFKCDQCTKSFAHVSGLNCHRRVHSGERPYKCPYCKKCYAHSTDLRRHRRTHGLEEQRFPCSLCDKKFYESKFLRSHMTAQHRDQNDGVERKTNQRKNVVSTTIEIKTDECLKEEYLDYEYINSD